MLATTPQHSASPQVPVQHDDVVVDQLGRRTGPFSGGWGEPTEWNTRGPVAKHLKSGVPSITGTAEVWRAGVVVSMRAGDHAIPGDGELVHPHRLPVLALLCEVAVAGRPRLVALAGEPPARVPEPRVGVEAMPACELGRVVFEHGAEPPEGTTTFDRVGELRRQVTRVDAPMNRCRSR